LQALKQNTIRDITLDCSISHKSETVMSVQSSNSINRSSKHRIPQEFQQVFPVESQPNQMHNQRIFNQQPPPAPFTATVAKSNNMSALSATTMYNPNLPRYPFPGPISGYPVPPIHAVGVPMVNMDLYPPLSIPHPPYENITTQGSSNPRPPSHAIYPPTTSADRNLIKSSKSFAINSSRTIPMQNTPRGSPSVYEQELSVPNPYFRAQLQHTQQHPTSQGHLQQQQHFRQQPTASIHSQNKQNNPSAYRGESFQYRIPDPIQINSKQQQQQLIVDNSKLPVNSFKNPSHQILPPPSHQICSKIV
jgi:hypothetical protein